MIFNNTITIYSYHNDPVLRVDNWFRTVIKGVQWEKRQEKSVTQQGVINFASMIDITIPFEADTGGREYISLNQWRRKSAEELRTKYHCWTIDAVSNMSIAVLGDINKDITSAYTITDLRRDYDDTAVISGITDATNAPYLKHWRVWCK